MQHYARRRARVGQRMGDAALVLPGGLQRQRSNDTEFRFRPDSDFHYLTGLCEPEAVLVWRPAREPALTMFVRAKDPSAEVWTGRRIGPQGAIEQFGADAAFELSELDAKLFDLLDGVERVYVPFDRAPGIRRRVLGAIDRLHRHNRTGKTPPAALMDTRGLMGEERIVKDGAALESLRHAVKLTVDAHAEAARALVPGQYEHEFEARLEYHYRRHGSTGPGYGNIVGAGDNATILHYVDNDAPMRDGELLLVDSGAEWEYFTGDLTRCYPVNGKFSGPQRDLYEVVLEANTRGVAGCVVGGTVEKIHDTCLRVLVAGLIDLGLLEGSVDDAIERETYKRYYMHRTSHWLGVDVHDVGAYTIDRVQRPLCPGHVLTVEPGLYVAGHDDQAPGAFRGIGIRLEDDVLVTDQGPDVLTAEAPKRVDAVESLVTSG